MKEVEREIWENRIEDSLWAKKEDFFLDSIMLRLLHIVPGPLRWGEWGQPLWGINAPKPRVRRNGHRAPWGGWFARKGIESAVARWGRCWHTAEQERLGGLQSSEKGQGTGRMGRSEHGQWEDGGLLREVWSFFPVGFHNLKYSQNARFSLVLIPKGN